MFVAFIFITTFFVMNLFISVIVDKFNDEIKRREGALRFTAEQKEWVKMQRLMVTVNVKVLHTAAADNNARVMTITGLLVPKQPS